MDVILFGAHAMKDFFFFPQSWHLYKQWIQSIWLSWGKSREETAESAVFLLAYISSFLLATAMRDGI